MAKRMLLVSPKTMMATHLDMGFVPGIVKRTGTVLSVTMATLAALTPKEIELTIVDENVEPIDFRRRYDLVGITAHVPQLPRAKEIAAEFRRKGSLIVCGGPSVSINPEQWRTVADVLVIGEAERTWPRFAKDYLKGKYELEYHETERYDLDICPVPDYQGYSKQLVNSAIGGLVQCSRGCPYNCEYCDAIVYSGRKVRYKPVDTILKEFEQLHRLGLRFVVLPDDNFTMDMRRAKEILRRLRVWNHQKRRPVLISAQATLDAVLDEEFLTLAAEAGVNRLAIGLESHNQQSLLESGKRHNLNRDVEAAVEAVQSHGIMFSSGCVVGFDNDDLSIFQSQFDYFTKLGIGTVFVFPLHAPEGTPLKERMIQEGRFLEFTQVGPSGSLESAFGSGIHTTLNTYTLVPKKMTVQQLQRGLYWLIWKLYEPENHAKRQQVFFETYERSPLRGKLAIPSGPPDLEGVGVLSRLAKYYLANATSSERRAIRQVLADARHSSHPLAMQIAIAGFLQGLNNRAMMLKLEPRVATLEYPRSPSEHDAQERTFA